MILIHPAALQWHSFHCRAFLNPQTLEPIRSTSHGLEIRILVVKSNVSSASVLIKNSFTSVPTLVRAARKVLVSSVPGSEPEKADLMFAAIDIVI